MGLKLDESKEKDMLNKSISPMHKFYDGTETPFGKYDENGEYHIYYDTTSRYGGMAKPIYGVSVTIEGKDGDPSYRKNKIFIGEAPHKDENDNWVTYNNVPFFYIGAFGGAHILEREPDIPHIIDICTDEWEHIDRERKEKGDKERAAREWELIQKIEYCSFKTYINGLWNRIQKRIGKFSHYKGKHSTLYHYYTPNGRVSFHFVNHWESKSLYFYKETDEWIFWTYFRKNGKWGITKNKTHNDGCCCEA